jgi:hypothetical protein
LGRIERDEVEDSGDAGVELESGMMFVFEKWIG